MYKRADIIKFLDYLTEEIQKKVYGRVNWDESMMTEKYELYILDRDIKCVFDMTDRIHNTETIEDADKIVYDIMQAYRNHILGAYIVG